MGEMKDTSSLNEIFKFYVKGHPQIKKFWKKKSAELVQKFHLEEVNKSASEESEEEEKPLKKVAKVEVKKGKVENGTSKLLNKKKQRESDDESEGDSEEESENVKVVPKIVANGNKKFAAEEKIQNNNDLSMKVPFKRIDSNLKEVLPENLKDNSYESFMCKTGDDYGKHANEKLKFTKGRDFKKEKTKFKNKTAFGGINISTQVRSIKLEDDSD